MRLTAIITFSIHSLFELAFGLSALISGASSSATPEQVATQTDEITIAFRFMGSALFALGVLGVLVLFKAGVQSQTAKLVATGFALFHGIGAMASLYTAAPEFTVYAQPLSLGAVVLHGVLAISFGIIAAQSKVLHAA